jgi:flavodoxin I
MMSTANCALLLAISAVVAVSLAPFAVAFSPPRFQRTSTTSTRTRNLLTLYAGKIGIFYGSSKGSTKKVAELIAQSLPEGVAEGPFDVGKLGNKYLDIFAKFDALIVGTPTWNTGAFSGRSGTSWDPMYYDIPFLRFEGRKVAVFGLGDQKTYKDNFADAAGELHDVFESLGCNMMGYTATAGYEHKTSKSLRDGKFCGLILDMVNQEGMTQERVEKWVHQLGQEGLFQGFPVAAAAGPTPPTSSAPPGMQQPFAPPQSYAPPAAAPTGLQAPASSIPPVRETPSVASRDAFSSQQQEWITNLTVTNSQLGQRVDEYRKLLDETLAQYASQEEMIEFLESKNQELEQQMQTYTTQEELMAQLQAKNTRLRQQIEGDHNVLVNATTANGVTRPAENGYTPHYNPATHSTMWTSADGRSCFYTVELHKVHYYSKL